MDESFVARSPLPGAGKLLGKNVCYWLLLYWIGLGSSGLPTPSKSSHIRKYKWFIFTLASSYCVPSCGSDTRQHGALSWEVGDNDCQCEGRQAGPCCLATDRIALCGPRALKVHLGWLSDSSETTWEPTHSVLTCLLPLRASREFLIVLLEYFDLINSPPIFN